MFASIISAIILAVAGLAAWTGRGNSSHYDNVSYETDLHWMRKSIEAMPPCHFNAFGSVIVNASDGQLLCAGYNSQQELGDPTEHGEINAIRTCVSKFTELGWTTSEISSIWPNAWIYTTAEPCPMCGSTILQAGFKRVVYGTSSPKLVSLGWTEYLVIVRNEWLAAAATVQHGFGAGRPVTEIVGPLGDSETNPLLAWQFDRDAPCPSGCQREEADPICRPSESN